MTQRIRNNQPPFTAPLPPSQGRRGKIVLFSLSSPPPFQKPRDHPRRESGGGCRWLAENPLLSIMGFRAEGCVGGEGLKSTQMGQTRPMIDPHHPFSLLHPFSHHRHAETVRISPPNSDTSPSDVACSRGILIGEKNKNVITGDGKQSKHAFMKKSFIYSFFILFFYFIYLLTSH